MNFDPVVAVVRENFVLPEGGEGAVVLRAVEGFEVDPDELSKGLMVRSEKCWTSILVLLASNCPTVTQSARLLLNWSAVRTVKRAGVPEYSS